MKINAQKIRKMASSVIRGQKHYGEHLMMSPMREWFLGLFVFLIIAGAGAFWAVTTFVEKSQMSTFNGVSIAEVEVYQSATVKAALNNLEERNVQYKALEERLTNRVYSPDVPKTLPATVEVVGESLDGVASSTEEIVPALDAAVEPAL